MDSKDIKNGKEEIIPLGDSGDSRARLSGSSSKAKPIIGAIVVSICVLVLGVVIANVLIKMRKSLPTVTKDRPVPIVVAMPLEGVKNYSPTITGYGSARAKVRVQVSPQVSGVIKVKGENFLTGRRVQKGELLLQIERTDYQQNFDAASSNVKLIQAQQQKLQVEKVNLEKIAKLEKKALALTEKQLGEARVLLKNGAGSEQDVDGKLDAKIRAERAWQITVNQQQLMNPQIAELAAKYRQSTVDLARAQTALDRTTVKSPADGIVQACLVEEGVAVSPGSSCGEILHQNTVEIPVSVDAAELQWLDQAKLALCQTGDLAASDQEISVTIIAERDENKKNPRIWRGMLARISPSLDGATRTALLIIEVALKDNTSLPAPNTYCKVTIAGRTLPMVYILNRSLLLEDKNVYVLEKRDAPEQTQKYQLGKKTITVARYTSEQVMILPDNGLNEGDRLVTSKIASPVIGTKAKPRDLEPVNKPAEKDESK